ncbi:MAG: DNA/RNA non-specific endonuclease [Pseudomonadota bacterium]
MFNARSAARLCWASTKIWGRKARPTSVAGSTFPLVRTATCSLPSRYPFALSLPCTRTNQFWDTDMTIRNGYDPNFLGDGVTIPLPSAGFAIADDVLKREEIEPDGIVNYIHYSVLMSRSNKQAFFSAANLDQNKYKSVSGRRWFVDSRIGAHNQIGPEYYVDNEWDRGHITRRTAVTFGSRFDAKNASNDSCSYANSSLQHENFNQDEWRVPEKIVEHFEKDKNGKLCIFTGPVFTDADRWYSRRGIDTAVRIPSGFWKVVAYIDKNTGKVGCQGYLMFQDANFIADKRGQKRVKKNIENYQVTITEIERLTNLEFPEILFNANPLYFFARKGVNAGPEAYAAPRSTTDAQLRRSVVFDRADLEGERKGSFERRRRVIPEDEFDKYIRDGLMT